MLKVLIVDDSKGKVEKILEIFQPYQEARKCVVEECSSINSAKALFLKTQYDLVVLDIQLPMRDKEEPRKDGGIELLTELHARTIYHKPICIVGLTEYSDILSQVAPHFEDTLWSVILFDASSEAWSERLVKKLEYLLAQKEYLGGRERFLYDLGIIVALHSPELDSLIKIGTWVEEIVGGDDSKYLKTEFSTPTKKIRVIATCAPQMGMPASAVSATKLISHFHPRYLAMVGISGGVRGRVALGDVVVADPCWDWGSGKRIAAAGKGFEFEPDPLPERLHPHIRTMLQDVQGDSELLAQVQKSWRGERVVGEFKLHIGPGVSGAAVVADNCTVGEISEHSRKLIGLDMEAYAVMHAAINATAPKPLAFSMKGISDFADNVKNDSMQQYAAYISAALLHRIALKYFTPNS